MYLKSTLITAALLLATAQISCHAKDNQTENPDAEKSSANTPAKDIFSGYTTQRVAEHTYVIHGPTEMPNPKNKGFMNNPGFIVTDKSVIVIDPGSSLYTGQALLTRIKEVTKNPVTHVFATHVHGDHWLGNHALKKEYPKAKFYAHPNMIEKSNDGEAQRWIETMLSLTDKATEGTEAVIPDQEMKHEASVKVDNITVKAHFIAEAHSNTDAMFEIAEDKVLFTGDNITHKRLPRMDDGTFKGNIAAADYALKMDVKHVVPGHGPSGGKEVLTAYRDYLAGIYETTKALMEKDMESFEMKPLIMEKVAAYKDWPGFEEQIGKHISIAVLEAEAEDF